MMNLSLNVNYVSGSYYGNPQLCTITNSLCGANSKPSDGASRANGLHKITTFSPVSILSVGEYMCTFACIDETFSS